MTILFVTPFYEEKGESPQGGVSMYLRRVAGALKEYGHTPIIMTIGKKDMHYMDNDIEVFFVCCPELSTKMKYVELICNLFYKSWRVNQKITKLLNEKKIDIIQFSSILGLSSCYFKKVPAVMRLSTYSKVYREYRDDKIRIDIISFMERLASKRCNAVFAPSNVIAKAFSEAIHRNVSVIETPYWNECKTWDDSVYKSKVCGKKYVLFYGRLVRDKGILVIAECLEKFLESNPDYYFVCCGIRNFVNRENAVTILRKAAGRCNERFVFINALPHHLLFPIVQNAQFIIFPSLIDNFPNACIEAMHLQKVVIGTDGTSFEQLITDGKNGLLCQPGSAKSLFEKMSIAAAMTALQREQMGEMAEKRIEQLAPEYVVRKLLRYYQYILDHV